MNLIVRIVGASVISLVLFWWYVYAAINRRDQHAVDADELLDRELRPLRLGHRLDESLHRVVGRHGQPLGLHLAQFGQALVPQVGVPRVVVAVRAEAHLHVELGDRGDPAAERLEQLHLGPLVVTDPARRLDDVERTRAVRAGPTVRTAPSCRTDGLSVVDRHRATVVGDLRVDWSDVSIDLVRQHFGGTSLGNRRKRGLWVSAPAAANQAASAAPSSVAGGPPPVYSSSIARHGARRLELAEDGADAPHHAVEDDEARRHVELLDHLGRAGPCTSKITPSVSRIHSRVNVNSSVRYGVYGLDT